MSKRILFVDDEPEWRLIPSRALREAGYDVIIAKDVFETGLQTHGVKLDLIILDVNLGTENAPGLMRLLKEGHPGVPILLYSGLEEQDLAVQNMMKEGAQGYLRKGPMSDLLDGVRTALEQ
jgi:two-component system cell cycle sensor histidine kinase/response regulator CckA